MDIMEKETKKDVDPTSIQIIEHILIRDKDSGHVFVNKRGISAQVKDDEQSKR